MTSNTSDTWSPRYGTGTRSSVAPSGTPFSPSGFSYSSGSPHVSSGGSESGNPMRRVTLSSSGSYENSDDSYTDDNSIDEVEAALNNLENNLDDTEQALTEWSHGSSSNQAPSYTTGSFTGSYTGTYTGSTSYVNLPTVGSRPLSTPAVGPAVRLSRITERTEESRPSSGAFSAGHIVRPTSTTGDGLRRSALLSGATAHARSSTEPTGDPTLPRPGRATELIAVFETQTPGHARAASAPGIRSPSPHYAPSQTTSAMQTTTGYTYGPTSFGFNSRSSSPTKSRNGSTVSYTDTRPTMSSLLSPPPPLPPKDERSKVRATSPGFVESRSGAGSYLGSGTQTPSTFSSTLSPGQTNTGARTSTRTTDTQSYTTSGTTTVTGAPASTLRRPQTSPRSPLASVRNIVALWKERTPAAGRPVTSKLSTSIATSSASPQAGDGLHGIRQRVQRAGERLRETNVRAGEQTMRRSGDEASLRTSRSGGLPPGFDVGELSHYAQSNEAPLHIGLLWYLNVHAPPPYRWQRCQALLYPHMLLLSWLAPGGGRGIVALDLLNCINVQSTPSPTHPNARDDVGTVAARLQSSERDAQPLMDMLVPFQMLYADGVERLAAESLLERQRWVNRILDAVNRPISAPGTSSVTRSPTGSIRTILSIDSRTSGSSSISTGSRSTVYVPPMSTLTDIPDIESDFSSNSGASASRLGIARRVSLGSSHHKQTVDDTVIQNQEYLYPGDPRHIPPSRGNSLRRTGSMNDLDQEFARALKAKKSGLTGSPVTISSGPSLGQDIFITPPPSVLRGSDRSRSESQSDEAFHSAGESAGMRSNVSSTYYSQSGDLTATGLVTDGTLLDFSSRGSRTQTMTSTPSYQRVDSSSYLGDSQDQTSYTVSSSSRLSTLSRAREVRRRLNRVASRSLFTGYEGGFTDKENSVSGSGSYTYSGTPSGQSNDLSGSYTPGSGDYTAASGSYTPGSGDYSITNDSYTPGSGSYSGSQSYTPGSGSNTGTQSFTPGSGSYTLESGSGSYTPSKSYTSSDDPTPGSNGIVAVRSSSSESRSAEGSITLGTETGYDVCPSSDLSGLTPPTTTEEYSSSPAFSSPMYVTIESDRVAEVESEDLAARVSRISRGSSDYLTARVPSSRDSVASYDTCPTIPSESDYATAEELSTYSSAQSSLKVPSRESLALSTPAPESEYITAPVIPSEVSSEESTPRLSSVKLEEEALLSEVVSIPSRVPTIRSLASSAGELSPQPQNVPLPPSVVSSQRSLPPTPLLPPLLPTTRLPSSPSVSVAEDSRSVVTSISLRDLPPLPPSPATLASEGEESLLRSLSPAERWRAASVRSPSSILSLSEPREPGPVPLSRRRSTVASLTESSVRLAEERSPSPSSPSSSPPPPSSMLWPGDDETDRSFDSSQLQPSPSMMSFAIPEIPDRSFETPFLRPSGSVVSSVNKLSTLPISPSVLTSRTPLPQHTPPVVPRQVPSVAPRYVSPVIQVPESPSSVTPTTQTMSSSSSSFLSGMSSSSPSIAPQPSLSESLLDSHLPPEEEREIDEESVTGRGPRTISTLLSTVRAARSPTPVPIPPRTLTVTPEGSVVMSISTPYGSGRTEQASLRTEESEGSLPTPRDIARDIDQLAEDLRRYDDARGQENKEIADNVKTLRDELHDLSDFLRQTPPPNVVRIIEERVVQPPLPAIPHPRAFATRSVGGSSEITSLHYLSPGDISESVGAALTRASSITSIGSFLSSHHSDDLSLYSYPSAISPMPPISDVESEFDDESSFVSSSDVTPSETMAALPVQQPPTLPVQQPPTLPVQQPPTLPVQQQPALPVQQSLALPVQQPLALPVQQPLALPVQQPLARPPRPSSSTSSASTARPAIDLTAPLNAIREQLNNLANEQAAAMAKLDSLSGRSYPDLSAVQGKLDYVELLLRDLMERFENQQPPHVVTIPIHQPTTVGAPEQVAPPQTAAVQHPSVDAERASLPDSDDSSLIRQLELLAPRATHPAGPSFAEQLQEILASSASIIPPAIQHPPPLHRFRFEPTEGSVRPRSASPSSLESLLPRPRTAPTVADDFNQILRNLSRGRGADRPRPAAAISTEEEQPEEEREEQPPPQRRDRAAEDEEAYNRRIEEMNRRRRRMPAVQPVFPPPRPPSAPSTLGGDRRTGRSWYQRPSDQPQAVPPDSTTQQEAQQQNVPMPPGPIHVQLPPIFEQLMSFVRESHRAQTATYQQQQDLARYMRELNEWLARDVNDRQDELRGITARLDQLANLTNTLLAIQSRRPESIGESEESVSEEAPRPPMFIPPFPMPMPEPQFNREGFIPPSPRVQQQQPVPGPVVVPLTPEPDFRPVIPSPIRQHMETPRPIHSVSPSVVPGVVPRPIHGVSPSVVPGVVPRPIHGVSPSIGVVPGVMPGVAPGVIPPPPVIMSGQRPGTVPPVQQSVTDTPIPFVPPHFDEHALPPGVIERSPSPDSSSVTSTSTESSDRIRHTRRRPSRSVSDHRTRSTTPRPYQPRTRSYSRSSSGESRESSGSSPPDTHIVFPPGGAQQVPIIQQPGSSRVPSVHVVAPSDLIPGTPRHPEWQLPPQQAPQQAQPTIILQQPPQHPIQPIQPIQPILPMQPIQQIPSSHTRTIILPQGSSGSSSPSTHRSSSRERRSRRSSRRGSSRPRTRTHSEPPTPQVLPIPTATIYPAPPLQPLPMIPQPGAVIMRDSSSTSSTRSRRSRSHSRSHSRSPSRRRDRRHSRSPSRRSRSHSPTTLVATVPGTAVPTMLPTLQPIPSQPPTMIVQAPTERSWSPGAGPSIDPTPLVAQPPPIVLEGRRSRSRSPRHRSGRHSRSPPISYPSDHERSHGRGRRRSRSYSYSPRGRHRRRRSHSYSYSPGRRHRRRYYSYSRSTSPSSHRRVTRYSPPISRSPSYRSRPSSHRHVTRHSPPISRSPSYRSRHEPERYRGAPSSRHRSPSYESVEREVHPSPSAPSRATSRRSHPRDREESARSLSPVSRGSRRGPLGSPERPRSPGEERSPRLSDLGSRDLSPPPLPRPMDPTSQRRAYRSRSPTPTRSPTPRYVRAPSERGRGEPSERGRGEPSERGRGEPSERGRGEPLERGRGEPLERGRGEPLERGGVEPLERGRGEPIKVVVPRRDPHADRPPTIMSLGPEEEHEIGEAPPRPVSGEPFSARPSLYTPSRRPSTRQSPRAEPGEPGVLPVPRDEEESYRGEPTIQEPPRRRPSERTVSGSVPSRRPTPLDLDREEEQEQRLQRLEDVESRLHDVSASMREAEDRRELAFRQNEDDRYRIFLENQERRDQEAREHAEQLLETIDSRLVSLVPAPPPAAEEAVGEEPETVIGDTQSMIDSVRTASQEAAAQYSREIQDIIKAEREEFAREREAAAAEREHLLTEAEAERNRLAEEREARIRDLEEQLASVKQELEDEKQRRITEEAETQERQRQELEERDEAVRNQLGDITNLIHDQRQVCEAKKELMQAQWEEKQLRRADKDAKWIELRDMVLKLHDDLENDRAKTEEYRQEAESKPGYDKIIEELTRQNAEQRELLTQFSESWRADCIRHHEETINAVRQTAQEQVPFNVQGYLDEFSKALATEVRMLLGEVGKLREERRALQHEIGFLLTMRSKYGPGGEFEPEWRPPPGGSGGPGGPPGPPGEGPPPEPQPPAPEQPPTQVRPGWRPVPRRKKKNKEAAAAPAGPSTAPPVDPRQQIQSWATWQPDPQLAPTPPSVEPTLLVPNRGSPGLFGPRSPRSSYYAT